MRKLIWLTLILLSSCFNSGNKGSDNVLARVYNDYLYEEELKDVVPSGVGVKDSLSIVKNYINNWVNQKLLLYKAEKNLLDEDLNFDQQLEDYRNSLIIFKYESKLISQSLDTVVTDSDIELYYNENIENFQLKNNIVKTYYARFEKEHPELRKVRNFFHSTRPEFRDSLEVYVEEGANLYFLNDETWILFDDLLRYVPITTYNNEAWLQNHRKIELSDDEFVYFANITDFKIKDGTSPMGFEKENIRQIIINKRKLFIINEMRDEVYQSALEKSNFEIY